MIPESNLIIFCFDLSALANTSSWVNDCSDIPEAKLVSSDKVITFNPNQPASSISCSVLIPTADPFNDLKYFISAGVSYIGPIVQQ